MYELKNGQRNTIHTSLCLCSDSKQTMHFFQNKNILNFSNFTKEFNLSFFARVFVRFYQASFSFFLGGNCRYYPSCSNYAHEAFSKHKFLTACYFVSMRLLSCHPFSSRSLYDPVPLNSIEMSQYHEQSK